MNSLRNGSFYVTLASSKGMLYLEEFSVEKATVNSAKVNVRVISNDKKNITINLINDGKLIKIFERETPVDLSYRHEISSDMKKSYFRISVESKDGEKIMSNPLFLLNDNK